MTSGDELRLRRLLPEELERLFSFYRETLPSAERVITLYRWRIEDPTSSGGVDTYVAEGDGRLLGAMSLVPVRLTSRGEFLDAAWYTDSVVHPAVRGRGIGSRLLDHTAVQAPITFAKGTVEPMYRLRKRAGFRDVPRDRYLLRPMTPVPRDTAASLKRKALFLPLWLVGRISRRIPARLETVELYRFDTSFDRLADQVAERPGPRPYKPSDYLNWRYFRCPVRTYRVFAALREGRSAGAIVLRIDEGTSHDAWIVDLVADDTDRAVVHALLKRACEEAVRGGVPTIRTFATSPRVRQLLWLHGFVSTRETPRFTYHVAPTGAALAAEEWSFFHGDCDTELLD